MTDVDTTAADVLEELDADLAARGVHLVFAELKDPVRRKLERYGLTGAIGARDFFPTLEAAVSAFRLRTGARWTSPTAAGAPDRPDPDTGPDPDADAGPGVGAAADADEG
jgi:hypothetical protein